MLSCSQRAPIRKNNMLFETIACPICEKSDYAVIFKSRDFRLGTCDSIFQVVRCKFCRFIFLNPRPKGEEISKIYPFDFNKSDKSILYKIIEPCFSIANNSTTKLLQSHKKTGKVLDIGCGNGSFLGLMQKKGFDVWGVETNTESKAFAPKSLKERIFYKKIEECGFSDKSFDIVTMFHSLEHILDLKGTLGRIKTILKDDGILYICVPNADFYEFKLFKAYNHNLDLPRHLNFFSRDTLERLLSGNGFMAKKFLNNSIFESVLTPASFYHSFFNFMDNRKISLSKIIKRLTFFPFVIMRMAVRLFFIFDGQNLEVLCFKK